MDKKGKILRMLAQRLLSDFDLAGEYHPNHGMWAIPHPGDKVFTVFYSSNASSMPLKENETRFNINVSEKEVDILWFIVEKKFRQQGHGKSLYRVIEGFARKYGCERTVTSPSGMGIRFWQNRGFVPSDKAGKEGMLEKVL